MSEAKTDMFLSHDWGDDGVTNHRKVTKINEAIQKRGYITWFDNERMTGNIRAQMANGIQNTKCFIAFITKRYHDKVVHGKDTDNCKAEFDFASTTVKMLAVVLDKEMKNPNEWKGNIALSLKSKLYVDLTGDLNDEKYLSTQLDMLQKELDAIGIKPKERTVENKTKGGKGIGAQLLQKHLE